MVWLSGWAVVHGDVVHPVAGRAGEAGLRVRGIASSQASEDLRGSWDSA